MKYSDKIEKILAAALVLHDDISGRYMRADGHFASDADIRVALEDWLIDDYSLHDLHIRSPKHDEGFGMFHIWVHGYFDVQGDTILDALIAACEWVA